MSIYVKICGVCRPEDAEVAVEAGANAVGIILSEAGRIVTVDQGKAIRAVVPENVDLVGVFRAPESADAVTDTATEIGVDKVQLHSTTNEIAEQVSAEFPVVRAYSYVEAAGLDRNEVSPLILIDGVDPGSGLAYDYSQLSDLAGPFMVAGGLTPDNVKEAVQLVQPFGVDVSSGVCLADDPRAKDHDLIRRFVANARAGSSTL